MCMEHFVDHHTKYTQLNIHNTENPCNICTVQETQFVL